MSTFVHHYFGRIHLGSIGFSAHHLLSTLVLWSFVSVHALAQSSEDNASQWSSAPLNYHQAFYVRNVGTGGFITGANAWATQISVTSDPVMKLHIYPLSNNNADGLVMQIVGNTLCYGYLGYEPSDQAYSTSTISGWKLFRESSTNGYIDLKGRGNGHIWTIKQVGQYYRIQTAVGDPYFPNADVEYARAVEMGKPVVFDAREDDNNIDWEFIPANDNTEQSIAYSYDASTMQANVTQYTFPSANGRLDIPSIEQGPNSNTVPSGSYSVYSVSFNAFHGNQNLRSVSIPSSMTGLYFYYPGNSPDGDNPFSACPNLEEITVAEDNSRFDSRNNCNAVIETETNSLVIGCNATVIPEDVTSIYRDAFYQCTFDSIVIPASVQYIGRIAFGRCNNLKKFIVMSPQPYTISAEIFNESAANLFEQATLYVPKGSKEAYANAEVWQQFATIREIGEPYVEPDPESDPEPENHAEEYYALQKKAMDALYSITTKKPMITSVDQLSSPWSDSDEGDLSCLLDDDVFTYWHSDWRHAYDEDANPIPLHTHYLQVSLPEYPSDNNEVWMRMTRRTPFPYYHITQFSVYGSNSANAPDEDWELVANLYIPFEEVGETRMTPKFNTAGYKYLRFYIDDTNDNANPKRCYGHMSGFQLYSGNIVKSYKWKYNNSIYKPYRTLSNILKCQAWMTADDILPDSLESLRQAYSDFEAAVSDKHFVESAGLIYRLLSEEDRTLELLGGVVSPEMEVPGMVELNSKSYHVKQVAQFAFYEDPDIISLSISEGVERIESNAFGNCDSIEAIHIPSTINYLAPSPFNSINYLNKDYHNRRSRITVSADNPVFDSRGNCNAIIETATNTLVLGASTTVIPDGITNIGDYAFEGTQISTLSLPESVTELGHCSYRACTSLTSIKIPDNIHNIVIGAFSRCYRLTKIELPNGLEKVEEYAFDYAPEGRQIISYDRSPKNLAESWYSYDIENSTLYVPAGTKTLYEQAEGWKNFTNIVELEEEEPAEDMDFEEENLAYHVISSEEATVKVNGGNPRGDVIIPSSVTHNGKIYSVLSIGEEALRGNINITSLTISEGVERMESLAIADCDSLSSLHIPSTMNHISWSAYTSYGNGQSGHHNNRQTITVAPGNPIYDSRDGCNAVIHTATNQLIIGSASTIVPDGVTAIGDGAFEGTMIKDLSLPESVTSIGSCAYRLCNALTKIKIPNNITHLTSDGIFSRCYNLQLIELPDGLTEIGPYCFDMPKLGRRFISKDKNPQAIPERPGAWAYPNDTLVVPGGTKELYQLTDGWNSFAIIQEQTLETMDGHQEVVIGDGDIASDTDLEGTIIGSVFYNINSGDGHFNASEGCIEITKPVTDESMEQLEGKDIFGEDVKNQFTGIVIMVPRGTGNVMVTAETTGNMTLKVKIGNNAPIEMELEGKLKVTFPYNVEQPTYVYIYAGQASCKPSAIELAQNGRGAAEGIQALNKPGAIKFSTSNCQFVMRRANASDDSLKIYGIEFDKTSDMPDGIVKPQTHGCLMEPDATIYNLSGQRFTKPIRGVNIMGRRKVLCR